MKQGQLKSIFVLMLILSVLSFVAYAATHSVTLNYPVSEWVRTNSVDFNFTVNSTGSVQYCAVYANNTGVFAMKANYTDIVNATKHTSGIAINDSVGFNAWGWNVTCANSTGDQFNSSLGASFGVDGNVPSITQDSPANNVYLENLNNTLFQYTPTDTSNPNTCFFYTNLSGVWQSNQTNNSYASGVQISVNLSINANNYTEANIPARTYAWAANCNDSSSNSFFTQNRTFTIDNIAPTAPSISTPAVLNSTNSTLYIEWSLTTETNFDRYESSMSPYLNMSDPIQSVTSTSIVNNNITFTSVADGSYFIQVRAYDKQGHSANSTVRNYLLDRVAPLVVLNAPSNETFTPDSTQGFRVTITDVNPAACALLITNSGGSTLTENITNQTIANGTTFSMNISSVTVFNDGIHFFQIECNDTVNHRVNASLLNYNLTVDTILPTAPFITSRFHQTNNTDKFPTLVWNEVTEANFSRYLVQAKYHLNDSVAYEANVTTKTLTSHQLNLSSNYTYVFNVTAYDRAGNTNSSGNTTIQLRYFTDPICAVLNPGWNICGAVWTSAKTLGQIGNETGASIVATFNATHQWAACNVAVSATGQHCNTPTIINSSMINVDGIVNASFHFGVNHAFAIYVNTTTDYRNRTWEANGRSGNITLTNASNIGWNLETQFRREKTTFGFAIYNIFGLNVSMISMPVNNGTTISYVNKNLFRSINNNTDWAYGRAMWMFYNETGAGLANNTYVMR